MHPALRFSFVLFDTVRISTRLLFRRICVWLEFPRTSSPFSLFLAREVHETNEARFFQGDIYERSRAAFFVCQPQFSLKTRDFIIFRYMILEMKMPFGYVGRWSYFLLVLRRNNLRSSPVFPRFQVSHRRSSPTRPSHQPPATITPGLLFALCHFHQMRFSRGAEMPGRWCVRTLSQSAFVPLPLSAPFSFSLSFSRTPPYTYLFLILPLTHSLSSCDCLFLVSFWRTSTHAKWTKRAKRDATKTIRVFANLWKRLLHQDEWIFSCFCPLLSLSSYQYALGKDICFRATVIWYRCTQGTVHWNRWGPDRIFVSCCRAIPVVFTFTMKSAARRKSLATQTTKDLGEFSNNISVRSKSGFEITVITLGDNKYYFWVVLPVLVGNKVHECLACFSGWVSTYLHLIYGRFLIGRSGTSYLISSASNFHAFSDSFNEF